MAPFHPFPLLGGAKGLLRGGYATYGLWLLEDAAATYQGDAAEVAQRGITAIKAGSPSEALAAIDAAAVQEAERHAAFVAGQAAA
jgi:hypothetical protein